MQFFGTTGLPQNGANDYDPNQIGSGALTPAIRDIATDFGP